MSLKEELVERLPKNVTDVTVTRNDIHGLEAVNVVVNYRVNGRLWFLDMNFAHKNKMDAEHIASVLNSYLKLDGSVADWENEGGNGTHHK